MGVIREAWQEAWELWMDLINAPPEDQREEMWDRWRGAREEEAVERGRENWDENVRPYLEEAGVDPRALDVLESYFAQNNLRTFFAPVLFTAMYFSQQLQSVATLVGSEAAYDVARDVRASRPSPRQAWDMVFAGELDSEIARDALRDLGWSEQYIDALEDIARTWTDPGRAVELYRRGEIGREGFFERLERLGFSDQAMSDMETLSEQLPGPGDVIEMAVREAWRDDVAAEFGYDQDFPPEFAEFMEKRGYDPEWATRYWRAHWTLPSLTRGYELFHRGIISEDELRTLLRVSDIPSYWRDALMEGSYRTLTRVDIRRMFGLGVLDRDDVYDEYLNFGYSPENAEAMTEFTVRYETEDGGNKGAEFRDLTRSVILTAYERKMLTRDQARSRLEQLDYTTEDAELLLELEDWESEVGAAPDPREEFKDEMERIVETGFNRSIIGRDEAQAMLSQIGYSQEAIEFKLQTMTFWRDLETTDAMIESVGEQYTARGINRGNAVTRLNEANVPSDMQASLLERWDIERKTRDRRATEAQYRKALQEEYIGVAEYQENLRGLGYTEYDVWVYTCNAGFAEEAGPKPTEGPIPST